MIEQSRIQKNIERWISVLKENGYRITTPRKAVLEVIAESEYAITPVDIFDQGRNKIENLGLVTVYRTLEKMEELGLVLRVHQTENCQAFVAGVDGHEHILICENCGRIDYFEGVELESLTKRVAKETDFLIKDHWLQFFGLCKECQKL
jgi:Fe2+ or Zn2+ uptake regulation protein